MQMNTSRSVRKILVIRFSSIGDIVLTSPVVRILKQQLDCEIHYLCKEAYFPVLEANPHIDHIHLLGDRAQDLIRRLRAERFDLIVDLHRNLRTIRFKGALRRPSVAFDKINLAKWLMVNLKWDRLPRRHVVDRYLDTVRGLGVRYDGKGLDYFIPEREEVDPGSWLPGPDILYIALVIGAAHATKRLPPQQLIALCRKLQVPVLLLGGPGDEAVGRQVAAEAGEHVINTCGALSLNQSASLVRQAWKVITHDTGLMHIAAAFQKEIFSLWGNTIPQFGMYPFFPDGKGISHQFEVEGLPCRPCSKIGFAECPRGHFKCMRQQDLSRIAFLAQAD
jgi:ADP-heptose:LPS heptosyltransferase